MSLLPPVSGYPTYVLLALVASLAYVSFLYARQLAVTLNRDCCNSTSASSFEDPCHTKRLPVPSIHSEPCKSVTVVFPAYNESTRMDPAVEEAIDFLNVKRKRTPNFSFEIIIVDDGSTDDTYQHAMKYVQRLGIDTCRVLRFAANRGKGAAVRAGVLAARGELVLFADSDGATQFSDFDRLHARIKDVAVSAVKSEDASMFSGIADKQGVVVGSRAYLESSEAVTQRQWYRNVLMHGFHALVTLVAGKGVKDTQCGFKLFTRKSARLLFSNLRLQRWCFDVELVYLAHRFKIPVVEENVNWDEVPGTKIQWWAPLSMGRDLVLVKAAYASGFWVALDEPASAAA